MVNIFIRTDPAGNIKTDKEKSSEKIDGAIATIMALGRAIRKSGTSNSVYDGRGYWYFNLQIYHASIICKGNLTNNTQSDNLNVKET